MGRVGAGSPLQLQNGLSATSVSGRQDTAGLIARITQCANDGIISSTDQVNRSFEMCDVTGSFESAGSHARAPSLSPSRTITQYCRGWPRETTQLADKPVRRPLHEPYTKPPAMPAKPKTARAVLRYAS